MQIQGEIGGQSVPFLVSTGSACDYLSWPMVRHLNLTPMKSREGVKVRHAGGVVDEVSFHVHADITFPGHPYTLVQRRTFLVMPSRDDNVRIAVLGQPWLTDDDTMGGITFSTRTVYVPTKLPITTYKPEEPGKCILLSTEII